LRDVAVACHGAKSVREAMEYALRAFSRFGGWCAGRAWRMPPDEPDALRVADLFEPADQNIQAFLALAQGQRLRPGEGLPGRVWASGQPELVTENLAEQLPASPSRLERAGLQAAAAFPVRLGEKVAAVLEFFSEEPQEPDPRILDALINISTQLARVMERKQLENHIAQIALQEQQRIGQEVHDTVIQELTGAAMIAEALRQKLTHESPSFAVDLERLIKILSSAQQQARSVVRGLLPVKIDAAGLMSALEHLAKQTDQLIPGECRFAHEGKVLVANNTAATHLYRIAQEAVHNAVKHSQASLITIKLTGGEQLELSVRDSGRGLPADYESRIGAGFRIMRHRADVIGARLEIKSRPNEGTSVVCTLRLK
jgi:signal transduction histidine kinase